MGKLKTTVTLLLAETPLPPQYKDHELKGVWKPRRELHLEPDWLLVYKPDGSDCVFYRLGTHSDLFGN